MKPLVMSIPQIKVIYPRYKREEKLQAKLSQEQVVNLVELRKTTNLSYRKLAQLFRISPSQCKRICMQILDPERYKRVVLAYSRDYKRTHVFVENRREIDHRMRKRKLEKCGKEYRLYKSYMYKRWKERNPTYTLEEVGKL